MTKRFGPQIRGSSDPNIDGCLIVPLDRAHHSFPNVSGDVPPGTYWRYDMRKRRVACMVTMVNGLSVAWDMCGTCVNHIRKCTCTEGFHATDAIWYLVGGKPQPKEREPLPPRLALGLTPPKPKRAFIHFAPDELDQAAERVAEQAIKKMKETVRFRRRTEIVQPKTNGFKRFRRR